MKELKVFSKDGFENLRTIVKEDGSVLFFLEDLSRILGLSSIQSIRSRLSEFGIYNIPIDGSMEVYVDEGNMYKCIFQSTKPEAVKFQSWVTNEVLPSIRKHGAYMTGEKLMEVLSDPRKMIEILTNLADERELRIKTQKELEVAKPKIDHYDRILGTGNLQTATVLSKSFGMTTQKLNKILLKLGVIRKLYNNGSVYGFTAKYEGKDYGNVKDLPIYKKSGEINFYQKSLVYSEKGKEMVSNLLLKYDLVKSIDGGSVIPNDKVIDELLSKSKDN